MVVVVSGPESSGKSQLCQELSAALSLPWVKEYARSYLEQYGPNYDFATFLKIYQGHIEHQRKAIESSQAPLIFLDTDSVHYQVWCQRVFKQSNSIIGHQMAQEAHHHYLLCKPDLPWVADPLRENPTDRDQLFLEYQEIIQSRKRPMALVSGQKKERLSNALDALYSFDFADSLKTQIERFRKY